MLQLLRQQHNPLNSSSLSSKSRLFLSDFFHRCRYLPFNLMFLSAPSLSRALAQDPLVTRRPLDVTSTMELERQRDKKKKRKSLFFSVLGDPHPLSPRIWVVLKPETLESISVALSSTGVWFLFHSCKSTEKVETMLQHSVSHTQRCSFSPVSQPSDVVVYLCRDALQDGVPEAFAFHHLPIVPVDHRHLHSVLRLVQLLTVHLLPHNIYTYRCVQYNFCTYSVYSHESIYSGRIRSCVGCSASLSFTLSFHLLSCDSLSRQ